MIGKSITAYAPGKLILSGEHAVVHGAPALVTAINRGVTATHNPIQDKELVIDLPDLSLKATYNPEEVDQLCRALDVIYQNVQKGKLSFAALQVSPCQFVAYAVQPFLEYAEQGHHFRLRSTLMIGSGTGSSAAAANAALQSTGPTSTFHERAHQAECLQHGNPSGVDLHVSHEGGLHLFQHGSSKRLPDLPREIHLVFSGIPSSNTGACVAHVQQFSHKAEVWKSFEAVTQAMTETLQDEAGMIDLIRENHRLLVELGVVPRRIQHFIAQVEDRGGAAKICGAGAIEGDAAGMIWVICSQPIDDLLLVFDFSSMKVSGDGQGTRII